MATKPLSFVLRSLAASHPDEAARSPVRLVTSHETHPIPAASRCRMGQPPENTTRPSLRIRRGPAGG